MAERRKLFPAMRLILLAAVAGVLAGALAVYVTERPSGNNAAPQAATQSPRVADSQCAGKVEKAKTVAAAAKGQVAAMLPADPPMSMAALSFTGPDGKAMSVADQKGRTLLVNLWATWCAPCRAEMPALDRLEAEMGGEGFEVMAINVDTGDDTKPRKFLQEIDVNALGYYRDSSMKVFNDLKSQGLALGLPVTLLIDGDGCLIAHMNGPAEWDSADAKTMVETALPN